MPEFSQSDWLLIVAGALALGWFMGRQSAFSGSEDRAARQMQERQLAEAAYASLPPAVQQDADKLIRTKNYIGAIKIVRENSGLDLRASKMAVDARKKLLGL